MKLVGVLKSVAAAVAVGAAFMGAAHAAPPIEAFIEPEVFRGAAMSSDGRYIAGVRHEAVGDVLVVLDWQTKQTRAVQYARADQQMEIDWARFKGDRILFSVRQKYRIVPGGVGIRRNQTVDDAFAWVSRIYSSNLDGSGLVSLYEPAAGTDLPRWVSANVADYLPSDADHVLLVAPNFNGTELKKVNIRTGRGQVVESGNRDTAGWVVDANGVPVLRQDGLARGRGFAWLRRGPGQRSWTEVIRFLGAQGANSGPTFEGDGPALGSGRVFVLARPEGKDTAGLYMYDTATGSYVEEVLSVPGFDVSNAIRDTDKNVVLAACYWGKKWTCEGKDAEFARHWRGLQAAFQNQANVNLVGRSAEARRWFIRVNNSQELNAYYVYNLDTRSLDFVGGARPQLEPEQLPTQEIVEYKSRDGTSLWGYLWVPPGANAQTNNLPLIVLPHGGPEGRDVWGSDPFAHWWASNGYAVFQPNFRGGGGFGRAFVEAGHRQWGQRMQEDVIDGAKALFASGRADPQRACLAGWSYGGYVTMTGSVINQDMFKCFFAGAGVSDQLDMLRWERDGDRDIDVAEGGGRGRQGIGYKYWSQAQGDEDSDRAMLERYSANRRAGEIMKPLLLIHGDEDEIVPVQQSTMLAESMKKAGRNNVELIILKDEGHQWRPMTVENRRIVLAESLRFFQQHLGPGYSSRPTN